MLPSSLHQHYIIQGDLGADVEDLGGPLVVQMTPNNRHSVGRAGDEGVLLALDPPDGLDLLRVAELVLDDLLLFAVEDH